MDLGTSMMIGAIVFIGIGMLGTTKGMGFFETWESGDNIVKALGLESLKKSNYGCRCGG